MTHTVAVSGASGRLGSVVCEVIDSHPDFTVVARIGRDSAPGQGSDADIWFDVSHPEASPALVAAAVGRGQRVIVGTSGWSADRITELEAWVSGAPEAAALVVPNFSLGSVLGTALAQIAAPYFDAVEIIETHHPAKVDSPSGTAVRTAELIAAARSGRPVEASFAEQTARGELVAGIPVHSLRLRGVVAQQEVRFGGDGEVLTVRHDTYSSDSYRAGIRAALETIRAASGVTVGLASILGVGAAA